jgi:hypothetical protein
MIREAVSAVRGNRLTQSACGRCASFEILEAEMSSKADPRRPTPKCLYNYYKEKSTEDYGTCDWH